MQRIDYIKMTAAMKRLTVGALLALTLNSAIATETTPRPPNVVLFLIDDLGWADLEMTGSTFYETPNLNQLAAEGQRSVVAIVKRVGTTERFPPLLVSESAQ